MEARTKAGTMAIAKDANPVHITHKIHDDFNYRKMPTSNKFTWWATDNKWNRAATEWWTEWWTEKKLSIALFRIKGALNSRKNDIPNHLPSN